MKSSLDTLRVCALLAASTTLVAGITAVGCSSDPATDTPAASDADASVTEDGGPGGDAADGGTGGGGPEPVTSTRLELNDVSVLFPLQIGRAHV